MRYHLHTTYGRCTKKNTHTHTHVLAHWKDKIKGEKSIHTCIKENLWRGYHSKWLLSIAAMGISGPNNHNEQREKIFTVSECVCVCASKEWFLICFLVCFSLYQIKFHLCVCVSRSLCLIHILPSIYNIRAYLCMLVVSLTILSPSPSLHAIGLECIDIDAVATVVADELLLCLESLNWTPHSILYRNVWLCCVCVFVVCMKRAGTVNHIRLLFLCLYLSFEESYTYCMCINGMNQLTHTHTLCV